MIYYPNTKFSLLLRKIVKYFLGFSVNFLRSPLNCFNERLLYLFLKALRISSLKNKNSKLLTDFKVYPKYPRKLYPINAQTKNISIIIQGPIYDRNFIQSTIDWYEACGIKNIILSTSQYTKDFKRAYTVVYKNPKIKGLGNENSHLLSIQEGLKLTKDQDIVIKTRTDMRIFNELAFSSIPLIHKNNRSKLTKDGFRLGAISNNSLLMKINNISDHLYIGNAIQLKRMFSIPFREGEKVLSEVKVEPDLIFKDSRGWLLKSTKFTGTFTEFFGEQWFFNSFRKNCLKNNMSEKRVINYSEYREALEKYLDIIKCCIYILDPEELDLFWLKRNFTTLPSYYEDADQNKNPIPAMRLTRMNWLNLVYDDNFKQQIINYSESLKKNDLLV